MNDLEKNGNAALVSKTVFSHRKSVFALNFAADML